MSTQTSWARIGREWFWMLACYSVIIAPFGCELRTAGLGSGLGSDLGDDVTPALETGLFINEDLTNPLLIAGQNAVGDAFFVFGTRDENGNLEEIESILVRTVAGEESFVTFESGRPVHAQGADGSYAHISYEEVSAERLAANVELYDANTAEKSTYTADIDLEQTAAQIAELVRVATGQNLETTTLTGDEMVVKDGTERVRITFFNPLYYAFVLPLVAAVAVMTVILGQILVVVYEIVALVSLAIEAVLLAALSPLFLIAGILGDVVFHVELLPLSLIFDLLPPEPIVIIL